MTNKLSQEYLNFECLGRTLTIPLPLFNYLDILQILVINKPVL